MLYQLQICKNKCIWYFLEVLGYLSYDSIAINSNSNVYWIQ